MHNSSAYSYNVSQTEAGWILVTAGGIISTVSSALVLYIIAKSDRSEHTSTYHRIMAVMSISDMIMSTAISFTTLPMPLNVHEVYDFDGKVLGTAFTCEVGFTI